MKDLLNGKGEMTSWVFTRDGRNVSMNAHFITTSAVQEVAKALLELDGVDEVVIEVQEGRPHTPWPHPGGAAPASPVTPIGIPQETVRSGVDRVPLSEIFDQVQDIYRKVEESHGKRMGLFMASGDLDVERSAEGPLVLAMLHILRHFYGTCTNGGFAADGNGVSLDALNISIRNGWSRAVLIFELTREGVRSSAWSGRMTGEPGLETCPCDDSIDLTIARRVAERMTWSLAVENFSPRRSRATLRLSPYEGTLKVMVVEAGDHLYAIEAGSVLWGVSITKEDLASGMIVWQGENVPLVELGTAPRSDVNRVLVPGLVLSTGGTKRCVLVTRLLGLQEMVPDRWGAVTDHGVRWGLLNSGLRVTVIDPASFGPKVEPPVTGSEIKT